MNSLAVEPTQKVGQDDQMQKSCILLRVSSLKLLGHFSYFRGLAGGGSSICLFSVGGEKRSSRPNAHEKQSRCGGCFATLLLLTSGTKSLCAVLFWVLWICFRQL